MADEAAETQADGYYGNDNTNVEELDLSFLDEDDTDKDTSDDTGETPSKSK